MDTGGFSFSDFHFQTSTFKVGTGTAIPDTENVLQIRKIFGVSTDYLLNDEYESDTDIPAVHSSTGKPTKKYKIIRGVCIAGVGVAGSVAVCMIDCSPTLKWLSVFCIFVVVVALVSLIGKNT